MFRPLYIVLLVMNICSSGWLMAQTNNAIFGGGTDDGHDVSMSMKVSNNPIFMGGGEDGHDVQNHLQLSNNNIFAGGDADGHHATCFLSVSNNNIFAGGDADGHYVSCVLSQSNNSIFAGGAADGHTHLCYTKASSNGIFGGGDADGHSIFCYSKPSNNGIFAGGDADGHSAECSNDDPVPLDIGIVYVDSTAIGFNDGSSWLHAFTEMRSALTFASNNPNVDTILVAKGTYLPTSGTNRSFAFVIPDSLDILCGFPNGGGILTSRNPELNPVVLSGDIGVPSMAGDNSYHVVIVPNNTSGTTVDGARIRHGVANGFGFNQLGAGIILGGQITFKNIVLSENSGMGNGSVVYSIGLDAHLTFDNVELIVSPMSNPLSVYFSQGTVDIIGEITISQE